MALAFIPLSTAYTQIVHGADDFCPQTRSGASRRREQTILRSCSVTQSQTHPRKVFSAGSNSPSRNISLRSHANRTSHHAATPSRKHHCCSQHTSRVRGSWQRAQRGKLHRRRAEGEEVEGFMTAEEGWVPARRRRRDWELGPGAHLSPAEAVQMQLQVRRLLD